MEKMLPVAVAALFIPSPSTPSLPEMEVSLNARFAEKL